MGSRGTQLGHPSNPGREGGFGQPSVSGTGMRSRDHRGRPPSPTPVRPVILLLIGFCCQDIFPHFPVSAFSTVYLKRNILCDNYLCLDILFSVVTFFLSTTTESLVNGTVSGGFIFRPPVPATRRGWSASSRPCVPVSVRPPSVPPRWGRGRSDCPTKGRETSGSPPNE